MLLPRVYATEGGVTGGADGSRGGGGGSGGGSANTDGGRSGSGTRTTRGGVYWYRRRPRLRLRRYSRLCPWANPQPCSRRPHRLCVVSVLPHCSRRPGSHRLRVSGASPHGSSHLQQRRWQPAPVFRLGSRAYESAPGTYCRNFTFLLVHYYLYEKTRTGVYLIY